MLTIENIQLGEVESCVGIYSNTVLQQLEVKPAASPRSAGGNANLSGSRS
jgi:hypothetical protein